jgi:hypothetical protein
MADSARRVQRRPPSIIGVALDQGVNLNLDQPLRIDEAADLAHEGRRSNGPEDLPMDAADGLLVIDVDQQHACPPHVR